MFQRLLEEIWRLNLMTSVSKEYKSPISSWIESFDAGITKLIINSVGELTDYLISMLFEFPLYLLQSEGFREIYNITTILSISFAVPVGGWVALRLIAGNINELEFQETLKRIFFLPIFIVLVPYFIMKFIILVNRISSLLLSQESHREMIYIPENLRLVLVVFIIMYLIMLFKLVIWYAGRNFGIIFLIAIVPILYLVWCIPGRFDKRKVWIEEISTLFFTQLIHVIQLLILLIMMWGIEDVKVRMMLQIGGVMWMNWSPGWLSKYIGANVNNMNPRIGRKITKAVGYMRNPKKIFRGVFNVFRK